VIYEKCHNNYVESLRGDLFKVIILKPLTLLGLRDEVFSPSKNSVALHLFMIEGRLFKGFGG
jgi:hypothetical protein